MSDGGESEARERVGRVLNDKWALERVLGVGGMAAVYAARHRNGARAAVKVLHPELARHPEVRERFRREGYAANKVDHPGVVKVLDDDEVHDGPDEGTAYLVMELLEGRSLQDRLESGPPMDEREFLQLAASVLEVLEVAHARGVVHRDLKPENLFLLAPDPGERASGTPGRPPLARDEVPRIKVLDFGLARLQESQAITSYGLALGTPSFMSPEQAAGRIDEIDGRTDLFALAATGFRLRAGRRIHEGVNAVELVGRMANTPAPPIRSIEPRTSAAFARVIDRALQFRREDRYESAAAMRADALAAIESLDAGHSITQLALPAPDVPPGSFPPPREKTIEASLSDLEAEPPPAAPPPRRSGVARSLALILLTLIFVGGGVVAKLWLYPAAPVGPNASLADEAGDMDTETQTAATASALSAAPPEPSGVAPSAQTEDAGGDFAAEASAPKTAPRAAPVAPPASTAPAHAPPTPHVPTHNVRKPGVRRHPSSKGTGR